MCSMDFTLLSSCFTRRNIIKVAFKTTRSNKSLNVPRLLVFLWTFHGALKESCYSFPRATAQNYFCSSNVRYQICCWQKSLLRAISNARTIVLLRFVFILRITWLTRTKGKGDRKGVYFVLRTRISSNDSLCVSGFFKLNSRTDHWANLTNDLQRKRGQIFEGLPWRAR